MIGQFNPFPVYTAQIVGASFNVVNVRSTNAATELANDLEWIVN